MERAAASASTRRSGWSSTSATGPSLESADISITTRPCGRPAWRTRPSRPLLRRTRPLAEERDQRRGSRGRRVADYHVRALQQLGAIRLVRTRRVRGGGLALLGAAQARDVARGARVGQLGLRHSLVHGVVDEDAVDDPDAKEEDGQRPPWVIAAD